MSELVPPVAPPVGRPGGRLRHFLQNPVTVKELRSRMRGRRAFVVLTIYLMLMSGFISLVYLAYASAASQPYGPDSRQAGKVIFASVLGIQSFLVVFIGPAFTTGAISGEKERQTFDLLRTTLLSANSFVMGKLLSALSYVLLLILAAVPLQSIAFLLGGVALAELLISQLLIVVSAVAFALVGLFFSSLMRSTLASSIVTFGGALLLTIGLPIVAGIFLSLLGPLLFGFSSPPWTLQALMIYVGVLLVITNLPATLIMSEVVLLEEGSYFFFSSTLNGHTIYVPSPWYFYIFLYVLLSLLLYWLTVRRVRRIPDR
jgi:ABC-type transport system involved in multi-copper enzyme maturation permease subunit